MQIVKKNNNGGVLAYTLQDNLTPFTEPGQGLYAWVYESRYKLLDGSNNDVIKFGQYGTNAANGSVPQDTILSYTGTTTEPIVILWAKKFTDKEIEKGTAYQIEQIVNKKIGPRYEDGKSTETFYTSVDIIKEKVNESLYGSTKLDSYAPRESQQKAIDKMTPFFLEGGSDFLLGAIMRYGKNFTFLTTGANLLTNSGNILVLTNKPGVFDSLKNDINSHVYFDGWEYFELKNVKDKTNFKLDPNKISVVACSKQLADNITSGKITREFLTSQDWNLAFFDECHSGTDTDNFTSLNESLQIKHRVWASGTPFKTAASGGFDENSSFYYGYVEQQKDKRAGIAPDAVTLETYIPSINPQFANNPNFTDEEGFTLTKLFAFEDDRFVFGGELRDFLKEILGKSDGKSKFSPMRICQGKLDHTVWLLPANVKMITGLAQLIEEVAPEYKVLNATGNNVKDINKVHNAIRTSEKTITLTNMRFIEGTTVPEWTGAFVMSDTESVEKYFQFIFRAASPHKGKDKAFVFDFDPERNFNMVFEMANSHAINNNDTDSQEAIREWLDCMPVFRAGNGPTFYKLDVGDILKQIHSSDYRSASLLKSTSKYVPVDLINEEIVEMLENVNTPSKITISTKMVENGLTKGQSYNQTRSQSNGDPVEVAEVVEALQKIASIVAALPVVSYLVETKTVEGIISELDNDVFEDALSVRKEVLSYMVDSKILNTRFINLYL